MPTFSLTRDVLVQAPASVVHQLLEDFRQWREWSPWEDLDPDMQRTYSGVNSGPGAHYAWSGNSKAGAGTMEIVGSTPDSVDIDLTFEKPFKAAYRTAFGLAPAGSGTKVSWTMSGHRNPVMHGLGKVYFDRTIAKDFDRGLARLKARAEGRPAG